MIKNYTPKERRQNKRWSIEFTREDTSGFSFECTENGELLDMNATKWANYNYCMAHPEEFPVAFNFKDFDCWDYWTNPEGDCSCGEHIELWNEYMGACQCPKCGKWYNIHGQELLPPELWEPDDPYYD